MEFPENYLTIWLQTEISGFSGQMVSTPDFDIADSCIKSFSFLVLEKKSCAKEADEGKEKMPSPQIPLFFYFTDWSWLELYLDWKYCFPDLVKSLQQAHLWVTRAKGEDHSDLREEGYWRGA